MFDVTKQIVKSAKEDPILFPSNKKSNYSKIGDHKLAPASYLKTWSMPDKCDYETRKPLQDIDEQMLCAGINGDIHEITFLHRIGANLEYRDGNDLGLAHFASKRGDINIIKYLTLHGACPYDHILPDGQTVVHIAARHGKLALLKWMYNTTPKFNFDALDNAGANLSHYAVLGDKIDIIKWLYKECSKSRYKNVLKTPDRNGMDILSLSIALGHNDIRDFLRWVGTSKKSSRVKSNFFRSVTAYNKAMLIDSGSIKLKEKCVLKLQQKWREKKIYLDEKQSKKYYEIKSKEAELLEIQSMLENIKTEEERERKATQEEERLAKIAAKNEKEFVERMREEEKRIKLVKYRQGRVETVIKAAGCVRIAEAKGLRSVARVEQLLNEAKEFISLANGIPSGVEKIEYIQSTFKMIDECEDEIIVCKNSYKDSLKWKIKTIRSIHALEIDNFAEIENIQDVMSKLKSGPSNEYYKFSLQQLGGIGRKGYDAMIDIFPECTPGERARLHNAMSKMFAIRVISGALVIKEDDDRANFIKKIAFNPEIYDKWVRDAYDCIAIAEKGMVRARFYKDECLKLEKLVAALNKYATDLLYNGIETPLGYDPFCSKLQLPAFFRRIKRNSSKKGKRNVDDTDATKINDIIAALEKEEEELDQSLLESRT
jgi:hypothetical protein